MTYRSIRAVLVLTIWHTGFPPVAVAEFDATATNEALIGQLREIDGAGVGFHPSAHADGFVALDETPKFAGGILGSAEPKIHPALRELVRRGTAALPDLLRHLDDARPTGFTVGDGFMGRWFGVEYDPRDATRMPAGLRMPYADSGGADALEETFDSYTVKVGDVCFAAIGQIVNRQLNCVRYQPSLCLVVNSPVENPALAAAVRADWGDLTGADLARSLEADVERGNGVGGLQRLLFYFPEKGRPIAVRLLNRSPVDLSDTEYFFRHTIMESRSDGDLRWFRRTHDATEWAGLIFCLQGHAKRTDVGSSGIGKQIEVAKSALERIDHLGGTEEIIPVATFGMQKGVVDAVAFFSGSPEIDDAVTGLFGVATTVECASTSARFAQCQLIEACVKRLLRTEAERRERVRERLTEFCARIRRENRPENSKGVAHVIAEIEKEAGRAISD